MITKIIAEEKIQQTKKLIEKFDNIVIVCHVSPDGDAIGSSLGLYHFLNELDKNVTVVVPSAFPENLNFLAGTKDVLLHDKYTEFAEETVMKAELIFCLDFNVSYRLEGLEKAVCASPAKKVMIDHHLYPGDFCDVVISHPEVSSTSELIFRLICRMGMFELLTIASGNAIYTGMMTDTGNFTYNSNKPEMYFIIGELVKKGIDKDKIYAEVFNTNSANKLRLNGYAVAEKMEIFREHKAALIALELAELKRFHYRKGDSEGLVNVPLSIPGVCFSAFFREDSDYIKISLRSKGKFPVNKVASECFNGGGHLNAAGGEFHGSMAELRVRFIEILPKYKEWLEK